MVNGARGVLSGSPLMNRIVAGWQAVLPWTFMYWRSRSFDVALREALR